MVLQQTVILLLIVFAADSYVHECVSECSYSTYPRLCARVTLSIHNSAVTAWISGPDMVEWLQGELLPLPFSLTEAIFHRYGIFKVKQTTL